jgi:aldehyde dehydrogenase (NAD+)
LDLALKKDIDMGPLISRKQQQRVEEYINIGVERRWDYSLPTTVRKDSKGYFVAAYRIYRFNR